MIVDLSYIKNVLEVDVEDSQLQYLLHHYFDDICQKINVITTLTEQDISDIAMASTDETPMLGYNETSLFQDTIIYIGEIDYHFYSILIKLSSYK